MHCVKEIKEGIFYVGSSARRLQLFENIFPIPKGVSYNSYIIKDEKNVLFDTVDEIVADVFMENIEYVLQNEQLDYLVIHHMEPDHCAMIKTIVKKYPKVKLVMSDKAKLMLKQFFDLDNYNEIVTVKEDEQLIIGKRKLKFITAPMVHWPEVIMTYDVTDKILFSADAFGTFGALNGILFNDEVDYKNEWLEDSRRYYSNIVGKYGEPVQAVLKKASKLELDMICPLHGPIWRSNLEYILDKYDKWSRYIEEDKDGVAVVYASMYGNTENAAQIMAFKLVENMKYKVKMFDVSNTHISEIVSTIFKYNKLIIICPTYNSAIHPLIENLLEDIKALNIQNKQVIIIENGSWAPICGNLIKEKLEQLKNFRIIEPIITVRTRLSEANLIEMDNIIKMLT